MGVEHEGVDPEPYALHSIPAALNLRERYKQDMSLYFKKRYFGHLRSVKILISLRIRAV